MASSSSATSSLSSNAEFLYTAIFKAQTSYEAARRYFAILRQWAGTGKAYRGRIFTRSEVEEAISAFERSLANEPVKSTDPSAVASPAKDADGQAAAKRPRTAGHCWPRWALNDKIGVEVLAPQGMGKPAAWTRVTPVAIGYRGQKKHFLFVRSSQFEMDARRSEVRRVGGGPTVAELLDELVKDGKDPSTHPDWTDGNDVGKRSRNKNADFVAPGIAIEETAGSHQASSKMELIGDKAFFDELEGEFERMALLQRSKLVKIRTSDHPDPLTEPRATAGIRMPALTDNDVLMMRPNQAEKNLSSLQLETVTLAARRFRQSLPDGRTCGYVVGDGTGCGKGRCISALIMHLWNSGIKRHIWVSATNDLYYDACRDLKDLGADIPCITLRRIPPSAPLDKWGTEANKELFKHFGAEGDGCIFVTYSLLVQTGQRRKLIAVPIKTEETRSLLLGGDLLDEKLKATRHVEKFTTDSCELPIDLHKGDRVVNVPSLKALQCMQIPFSLTFERVLAKDGRGCVEKEDAKEDQKADQKPGAGDPKENGGAPGDPNDADANELTASNSRLGQLVEWMGGKNATGLICYDEVHKAKNLVPDKEDHASTKTGLFVDILQRSCPKSPVLYVSATAATEVKHLGYMSRLGLWGPGTAFEDFQDFVRTMDAGGVAGMEMLAINMKALGALSCKALAYVGTEFETRVVGLTKAQRATYDNACAFMAELLDEYEKVASNKALKNAYGAKFFKNKNVDEMDLTMRLWQFYWGASQKFFKAMCNAAKVPAAAEIAREAVEAGEQVCMSIWATGESRSAARMARVKDDTPGRCVVEEFFEGSLIKVVLDNESTRGKLVGQLYTNMHLRQDMAIGKVRIRRMSHLLSCHGRRVTTPEDITGATLPAIIIFRNSTSRWLDVKAVLSALGEKVHFELRDDELGERVIVGKVHVGPPSFRRAAAEQWHVKTIAGRPVGKTNTAQVGRRLRKGAAISFHDAFVDEHLSGPEMIIEHFLDNMFLTHDEYGEPVDSAVDAKHRLLSDLKALKLPPNAMDELVDLLGGPRKVAEMSGRSHRMKRKKDGSLAYVARSEELRCAPNEVNLVEQEFFQKGVKKVCLLTEVAAAGISLHADRRQVRKDFTPPRRVFISVELPWGADKAIQSFGRVHRANQLQPPRFKILVTPIAGEVRFTSAIARRMKMLGAVTKGDRMTSMGGGADKHMAAFDCNNNYGVRALATVYRDTSKVHSAAPDLLAVYENMNFLGDLPPATGRWACYEDFARAVSKIWRKLRMYEDMEQLVQDEKELQRGSTKEWPVLNRFFNRLLMLDIELQNSILDTFFAIYYELVRIDKANGDFDEGVENLNEWHGRRINKIEIAKTEVLYTEPSSGAETTYHALTLDRGVDWEVVKEMFDQIEPFSHEGFYSCRPSPSDPAEYFFAKEKQQIGGAGQNAATGFAQRRRKQYVVWRPDFGTGNKDIILDTQLSAARFEKIEDADHIKEVEAAWKQKYRESETQRIINIHVITGDVLTAWRLSKAENIGDDTEDSQSQKKKTKHASLHIVRAITHPDGTPIVGLKVLEEDLPQLKYVLECQHRAVRQEPGVKKSVRDITLEVSSLWVKRLRNAPEKKLLCASWFAVHKILAAEDVVAYSATDMRGVQMAIERLARAKVIAICDGQMSLTGDFETQEELEELIFPEEFVNEFELPRDPKEGDLEEWEERLLEEGDDLDDDIDNSDADEKILEQVESKPKSKPAGFRPIHPKKRKAEVTPDKSSKKQKKEKKSKKEKKHKKERRAEKENEKENDPALFDELFGAPSGGSDSEQDESKTDSVKARPPASPLKAVTPSQNELDMKDEKMPDAELDGGTKDEAPVDHTEGAEASDHPSGNLQHPSNIQEEVVAKEEPAKLVRRWEKVRTNQEEAGAKVESAKLDHPSSNQAEAAAKVANAPLEIETGKIWTYEVSGKKIAIRAEPDIESDQQGDYLENGELFNVVERRRGGKDKRVYLKLADGRGWAYDRSAKDEDKVVVEELQVMDA